MAQSSLHRYLVHKKLLVILDSCTTWANTRLNLCFTFTRLKISRPRHRRRENCVRTLGTAGKLMAFCIAGHHAGLANGDGDNRRTLAQRLALSFGKDIPALDPVWQQEIALPEKLPAPPLKADAHHKWFSYACFTRMLYSCLVDADFLDTEAFYVSRSVENTIQRYGHPDLNALQQRFNVFIESFRRPTEQA